MNNLILLAATLVVSSTVEGSAQTSKHFFDQLRTISPAAVTALQGVGQDYKEKCGKEPNVAQYKKLLIESELFLYRMANGLAGEMDKGKWAADHQAKYKELTTNATCE